MNNPSITSVKDIDIKFHSKTDLACSGITVGKFLYLITKLDEENGLLEEPFQAVVDRLTPVFDATENMWRAILIDGEVKGYWNCVPLNDEYQKTITDGKHFFGILPICNNRDAAP